jgi:hypothetical protein
MSWVSLADAVAVAVCAVVTVATVFVFVRKKDDPCCPHCAAKGKASCYELEGISAFGDVIDKCRYCEMREVYVVRGDKVELLKFTVEEWRLLRGKVPTEGFQSAQRLAARSRRIRGQAGRGEASSRERE